MRAKKVRVIGSYSREVGAEGVGYRMGILERSVIICPPSGEGVT
jgi:hypothetical protein